MVDGCTFMVYNIFDKCLTHMLHMSQAFGAFMKWLTDALFGLQYIWQMLGPYVTHEPSIGGIYEMVGGYTFLITIYFANAWHICYTLNQALGGIYEMVDGCTFWFTIYLANTWHICYTWSQASGDKIEYNNICPHNNQYYIKKNGEHNCINNKLYCNICSKTII